MKEGFEPQPLCSRRRPYLDNIKTIGNFFVTDADEYEPPCTHRAYIHVGSRLQDVVRSALVKGIRRHSPHAIVTSSPDLRSKECACKSGRLRAQLNGCKTRSERVDEKPRSDRFTLRAALVNFSGEPKWRNESIPVVTTDCYLQLIAHFYIRLCGLFHAPTLIGRT